MKVIRSGFPGSHREGVYRKGNHSGIIVLVKNGAWSSGYNPLVLVPGNRYLKIRLLLYPSDQRKKPCLIFRYFMSDTSTVQDITCLLQMHTGNIIELSAVVVLVLYSDGFPSRSRRQALGRSRRGFFSPRNIFSGDCFSEGLHYFIFFSVICFYHLFFFFFPASMILRHVIKANAISKRELVLDEMM